MYAALQDRQVARLVGLPCSGHTGEGRTIRATASILCESLVLNINFGSNTQIVVGEMLLKGDMHLTGAQLRAARGLLNLSVAQLAEQTGLALNTIRSAEAPNGLVRVSLATATLLRGALEQRGVVFIDPDELGPGVRLRDTEPLPQQARRRGN